MPYRIVQEDDQWCLEKTDTGEKVKGSCHADKDVTERMLGAIEANETQDADHGKALREDEPLRDDEDSEQMEALNDDAKMKSYDGLFERLWARISSLLGAKELPFYDGTGFKVKGDHWLAVWSNNFKDRDGEIFPLRAIDDYVMRVDVGAVAPPALAIWHLGKKSFIGQADWVAREGHFLVAAGKFTDAPERVKAYYRKHAKDTALSHGFTFPVEQFDGKHYHQFNTFEISLLPRGAEANSYTSLEGVKAMALDDRKRKYLKDIGYDDDEIKQFEADIDERGKALEAIHVEFKDFTEMSEPEAGEPQAEAAVAVALKELLPDLVAADADNAQQNLTLAKAVKAQNQRLGSIEDSLKKVLDFIGQTPKRASAAKETELDPDDKDDAKIIDQIDRENRDEKAAKAFPGFYDQKTDVRKYVPNSTVR